MLTEAIFKILEADRSSGDISTATAISKLTAKNPKDFVSAALAPYHYQSLQTLLGESTNNTQDAYGNYLWAKKHIIVSTKEFPDENVNLDKTTSPHIIIEAPVGMPIDFKGNHECTIFIDVFTDVQTDNVSRCSNIINRIKSRFIYTGEICSCRSFDNYVPGLAKLQMNYLKTIGEGSWDHSRLEYKCYYKIYETVNDA